MSERKMKTNVNCWMAGEQRNWTGDATRNSMSDYWNLRRMTTVMMNC
jgi:hypothetical protein